MTLDKIRRVIEICVAHVDAEKSWLQAEHDIVYLPLMSDADIPPESAAELEALGAFKSAVDYWAFYT